MDNKFKPTTMLINLDIPLIRSNSNHSTSSYLCLKQRLRLRLPGGIRAVVVQKQLQICIIFVLSSLTKVRQTLFNVGICNSSSFHFRKLTTTQTTTSEHRRNATLKYIHQCYTVFAALSIIWLSVVLVSVLIVFTSKLSRINLLRYDRSSLPTRIQYFLIVIGNATN